MTETDVKARIQDRRALYKMAVRYMKKGYGSKSFLNFLRTNWPTVLERTPKKELTAIVAVVWGNLGK